MKPTATKKQKPINVTNAQPINTPLVNNPALSSKREVNGEFKQHR